MAGDGRVVLTWEAPADDGGASITKYQYRYSKGATVDADATWTDIPDGDGDADAGDERTYAVPGLLNGSLHAFELRAVNGGPDGAVAGPVTATPASMACHTPALSGRDVLWEATLTVGTAESAGAGISYGYQGAPSSFGALSRTDFVVGGAGHRIEALSYATGGTHARNLAVRLDTALAAADKTRLALHVCGVTLGFDAASVTGTTYRMGVLPAGVDWSRVRTRTVRVSVPADAATAPGAPRDLAAAPGDGAVVLNWRAPASDGGARITRYQYRYSAGAVVDTTTATWTDVADGAADGDSFAGNETGVTVGSLTNGTQYAFEVRAVNGGPDGAVAGPVTATPAAAACTAPLFGERRRIWTGEVTVANIVGAPDAVYGFIPSNSASALTPAQFSIGANSYTIDGVVVYTGGSDDGDLRFSLTSESLTDAEVAALRVHVCATPFDFAGLTPSSARTYTWSSTSLDWSSHTTRTLHLSVPANHDATGAPVVSATARDVGAELGVDTSAVADADGLGAFAYEWLRVGADGVTGETAIAGATAATYTLGAADVGKRVRVRVRFTDGLGTAEARTSAPWPSQGTVRATASAPGAVRSLVATAGDGQVVLTWEAPADDGGRDIVKYRYSYNAGATATSSTWTDVPDADGDGDAGDERSVTVSGLTNGTQYAFRVRAQSERVRSTGGDGDGGTTVTATPVAGTCPTPHFGDRRHIWTGEMTVAQTSDSSSVDAYGYDTALSTAGALTPARFSIGANSYTIDFVRVFTGGALDGGLQFSLTSKSLTDAEQAALRLHVCATPFDFSGPGSGHTYGWATSLDWSSLSTRTLHLSVANTAAAGAPAVSGTAQVGATLAGVTDAITDADGLAAPGYRYEWLRVGPDGDSNAVVVATTAGYTLTGADAGRKVRLRVRFTDDLGNTETRTSAPYPARGTVLSGAAITIAASAAKVTGKIDWIHYTLTRGGDTRAALTVPVRLEPFFGNDWNLTGGASWTVDGGALTDEVTFDAGKSQAKVSISTATGFGSIGFSSAATKSGVLTARLGAVAGYVTDATAEVEVVAVPKPLWVVKFDETSYSFAEDGGPHTLTVEAHATSADMPPPSVNFNGDSVLPLGVITEPSTAKSPGDFGTLSSAIRVPASGCSAGADGKQVCSLAVTFTTVDDALAEDDETLAFVLQQGTGLPPVVVFEGPDGDVGNINAKYPATITDDDFGVLHDSDDSPQVAVVSTPRQATDTYGAWEHIEIAVTFNRAVTVSGGAPTFALTFGADTKTATYARGSGTKTLVFAYQVRPDDADPDGIAWGADALALDGASLVETGASAEPTLTHAAQGALGAHKVDGTMTASGAPTLASMAVTSTPRITREGETVADTYGVGETIRITATFSAAVTVEGAPELAFSLGNPGDSSESSRRLAVYDAGASTGTEVVFAYRVVASDADPDGIWLGTGADSFRLGPGGRIRAGGIDANLARAAPGQQSGHKVDGSMTSDDVAPVLQSATVFTGVLTLTYDEALDETSAPAPGDFSVSLGGASEAPSAVTVDAMTVTLTLATHAAPAQAVTVTYTPGTQPIQDLAGNDAAALTDHAVTNETPALPMVSLAAVDAGAAHQLAEPRFRVTLSEALASDIAVTLVFTQDHPWLADTTHEVTLAAGDTEATHGVRLSQDAAAEMSGDLTATVTVPDGAEQVWRAAPSPSARTATVAVVFPGFTLDWSEDAYTVDEGETLTATARLRTAEGVPRPRAGYTVVVTTRSDTATVNRDYTHIFRQLTVAAADWTADGAVFSADAAVEVVTLDDTDYEGDERFQVSLTRADRQISPRLGCTGARLDSNIGSCLSVVTITDDETLSVADVMVSSTPATGDTYLADEVIRFTVAFTAAVTVDTTNGAPTFAFTLGRTTKRAAWESGSESASLAFAYTVAAGDADTDGIAWGANALALEGATIRFATDPAVDADLAHRGAPAQAAHRVDAAAPERTAATFLDDAVEVVYDEPLDTGSTPAPGDYTLAGATATVSAVSVSGATVTLTLSAALPDTAEVTLAYTPGARPVRDLVGNAAAAFSGIALELADLTGVTVTVTERLYTTEAGGTAHFTAALGTAPAANVTVTPSSTDPSEGTVSGPLVFTPADWQVAQTVTVTGVDDAEEDGDVHYLVEFAVTSNDTDYAGRKVTAVLVTNVDDEANLPPAARPGALADGAATVTEAFAYRVPDGAFTDPDGDALTYTAALDDGAALPAWLAFDPAERTFSGTPGFADLGTLALRVTASDGRGGMAAAVLTLTVAPVAPRRDPALAGLEVRGAVLTLTLAGALDSSSRPSPAHFSVRWRLVSDGRVGAPRTHVETVTTDDTKVVLRLGATLRADDTAVRLDYDPARPDP
ncbi:MAG: hypothetical protein F4169_08920, partial [Gammaproteobacteria bacterium]|nr:hypothetical protein [Gammaproteobacteria bacterium]